MAEQDNDQSGTQNLETQNLLASVQESATMPMSPPSDAMAITNEAANIARELRTLAHRVESFKIRFAR